MHALDLHEHRRNNAAFGLSPADAPETENTFLTGLAGNWCY